MKFAFTMSLMALSSSLGSYAVAQDLDAEIRQREGIAAPGMDFVPAMPKNIRMRADFPTLNFKTGMIHYDGAVQMFADNGTQFFADHAVIDSKKKLIHLTGNISIYSGTTLYKGKKVTYDYANEKFDTKGLKISLDPILLDADSIEQVTHEGRTVYIARKAAITTHDVDDPNFWLRANKITVYPKDRITFNNLKLYAGNVPIFWLPYFSQPLDKDLGYHFVPGGRSNWGPFLLNRYGTMLGGEISETTGQREDAWLLAQWLFDIRAKRGVGVGADFYDTRLEKNENLGWLKLYYTNDMDPSEPRSGIPRGSVNEDRYRVEFKHRYQVDKVNGVTYYADANLTWLSDRYYLEDFEPRTYTINSEPDNTIGFFRKDESSLAGVYTRIKLNDFYQTDTRFPELFYEQVKRPITKFNILHQGSTSLGMYREDVADFRKQQLLAERATLPVLSPRVAEIDAILSRKDFVRFHTLHEFSKTFSPREGINITPRAGLGYTGYWEEGANDRNEDRMHFFAGIDASFKFSKTYPNVVNKRWGLNGLKHVIQPYTKLSVLSTNELDSSFSRIDRLTPSSLPRPLDAGSFYAIDDMNNWAIARLGIRNELLTQRDGGSHAWLTADTYIDYFFNDPELNRTFSNLYTDIYWHPLPWMSLGIETQFPILGTGSGYTEFATGIRFMPSKNWELSLNYRMLDNHPVLTDSNRIDLRAYTRLNESWGFDIYQQWELDDNTLELQQYTIHRDFDSWIASLGVLHRDNRNRQEYSIVLGFTLKEFPSVNVPLTIDQKE